MGKSLKKNYLYNMLYQILVIVIPVITTPYLTRTLGPDGVGASAYTISIVTYFILFGSLGTSLYGKREIAYVQDDVHKRSKVFFEVLLLKMIFMAITIIAYCFFMHASDYYPFFKVLLFEIVANVFDISWFYHGIENFKTTVIRNSIIKILSLICIFVFVKNPGDTGVYLLIYGLSTFIGNVTLWANIRKYITIHDLGAVRAAKHLKNVIRLFIPQVANQLYVIIDKTMLGLMVANIAEVGFYDQSERIVKIWITMITALGLVVMPRIASCYANKDSGAIEKLMRKTIRYVYFCSLPMIFGIIAVSSNLVPLYLGSGFEKSVYIINILSPIIVIIGLNNIIGNQFLLPTKQQRKYTIAVASGCVTNFVLNAILIPVMGSYGACIATILSEIVVLSMEIFFIRRQFDCLKLFLSFKNYLIASVVMFAVIVLIGNITAKPLINGILQITVGGVCYFTFLAVMKDEMIIIVVNTMKRLIKRRH